MDGLRSLGCASPPQNQTRPYSPALFSSVTALAPNALIGPGLPPMSRSADLSTEGARRAAPMLAGEKAEPLREQKTEHFRVPRGRGKS
jgi:hypothetical protein